MKKETFEEFLQEYWYEHLSEGQTKETSIDAEIDWESGLDVAELIELANKWGKKLLEDRSPEGINLYAEQHSD